jgi:hypothetical protein
MLRVGEIGVALSWMQQMDVNGQALLNRVLMMPLPWK